jgi:hypothetical protein
MRTAFLWAITQGLLAILTPENGTDRFSRNIGKEYHYSLRNGQEERISQGGMSWFLERPLTWNLFFVHGYSLSPFFLNRNVYDIYNLLFSAEVIAILSPSFDLYL